MKRFVLPLVMVAVALMVSCAPCPKAEEALVADSVTLAAEAAPCSYDFNAMPVDTLQDFKGGEGRILMKMAKADGNKIMCCAIPKGSSVGYHTHETDMEVIYVQQGTATVMMDSTELTYTAGMAHYCAKGHSHSIRNLGDEDLVTFNIVAAQP